MDILPKLNYWLEENLYTNWEDLSTGNISQDTIQAWVGMLINHWNNEFSLMETNSSLPMSYYNQTFDQDYEQLFENIANCFWKWFTMGWDEMHGGYDNSTDSDNSTVTTDPTPLNATNPSKDTINQVLNALLDSYNSNQNPKSNRVAPAPAPKPNPKSIKPKTNKKPPNKPPKAKKPSAFIQKMLLSVLQNAI